MTSFITIALGAFDIRDKVDSVDAKDTTTLTSSAYVQGIAAVCDVREESQIERRDDALRFERRMKRTLDFPQQRILLLEFLNRDLDRGDHALAMFAALEAPSETIDEHRAVRLRWEGNVELLRVHRDRVEASVTDSGLRAVVDRLDRSRFETASRRIEVGLRKLGGPACRIGQRQSMPVVTFPRPSTSPSLASSNNVVPPDTALPDPNTVPPEPNILPAPASPDENPDPVNPPSSGAPPLGAAPRG